MKVECVHCGHENEMSRLFCAKCGARIELSKATVRSSRGDVPRGESCLKVVLQLVVYFALASAIAVLLWPVRPLGERGSAQDARRLAETIALLSRSIDAGQATMQVVSEQEVNAYLARVLADTGGAAKPGRWRLGVSEINVSIERSGVTVVVLANWWVVGLSYEIVGMPRVEEGRFHFRVARARWGHLPLPGAAAGWMGRRIGGLFARMGREQSVLDQLSRIDLGDRRARLVTAGP